MLQNGVGWTTSSSSGPLPQTADIGSEIAETVPETAAIPETTVPETTVPETTVPETTTITEAAIPEDRSVPEDRRIPEYSRDTAVQEKLGRRGRHFLGAEFGKTRRPILQITTRKRDRVACRAGERGASDHHCAQRGESAPCEGA